MEPMRTVSSAFTEELSAQAARSVLPQSTAPSERASPKADVTHVASQYQMLSALQAGSGDPGLALRVSPAGASVQPAAAPAASTGNQDTTVLRGVSLADAYATLGGRNTMVTDMVMGSDNQISQLRVVDAVTHQVIAQCPPESLVRAQQEIQAYQSVAQTLKTGQ